MADTCCTCHARTKDEAALAFELRVATMAMAQGDLPHAKHHVAGAFGIAPTDRRTLEVFEALAGKVDLAVLPEKGTWFGEYALVAHALHRAGDRMQAIRVLAQVAEAMPHLGYEHALTAWVSEVDELDEDATIRLGVLFAGLARSTIGLHRLWPGERALLLPYAALAAAFASTEASGVQASTAAGILRRVGRYDEALELAGRTHDENALIQVGLAHRARGDGLAALRAFDEAATFGGEFGHERARCLYVAGDYAAALALFPQDVTDPELLGLRDLCGTRPPGDRVDHLDALRRAVQAPDLGRPSDATANGFTNNRTEFRKMTGLKMTITGWESPSNRLLMALNAGHTDTTRVDYTATFQDFPRPVLAQTRGVTALWVPTGEGPVQALPAPPEELTQAIGAIARDNLDADALWSGAAGWVAEARPEARTLLAAMVRPDPSMLGEDLPADLFRHQVACAFALAALPADTALPALESAVFGPVDWASAAGVIALGELARRDASAALRARAILLAVPDDLLPWSTEPRVFKLFAALAAVPGVPPSTVEKLRAYYKKHWGEQEEPEPAAKAAPAPEEPVVERRSSTGKVAVVLGIAVMIGVVWRVLAG